MTDSRGMSEAILLAAASALAYAVAYAYQSGYGSFYGLPPLLVSPTLGQVLQAAAAVGFVLLPAWNIASGIWFFTPRGNTALNRSVRRLAMLGLGFALLFFNALTARYALLWFGIVMFVFAFFEFVFPLITQRGVSGYENKLLAQEETEAHAQQFTLIEHVARGLGETTIRMIVVALVILILANLLGARAAKTQEDFFVMQDRPGFIVAAMDDSIVVLAGFDSKKLVLTGFYQVEQLSEAHAWRLQRQHLGRLAPPPKAKPRP